MKVIRLSKSDCNEWVMKKHYSRRAPIFWAGFGLEIDGMVEGVCVYGQPSPPIQKHAFTDRDFKLFELSRLVVQTSRKNAASFLVGNSLKMLTSPCSVISYADTEQGHSGIIYQATNWHYTGATKSHDKAYIIDGKRTHPMTLRDRGITDPGRWAKENDIETVPPMEKHRYFQFVGNKRQCKLMKSKLVYPILEDYPKSDKTRYDDGEEISMIVQPDLI
tara:strand:- start:642 stop:1298 length:657 start_codon:yes stop_codon:yes gene_type:complete